MAYPNAVIDGKGRFVQRRILEYSVLEDELTSDRRLLDLRKLALRVVTPFTTTTTLTETFNIFVFNDDSSNELKIKVKYYSLVPSSVTPAIKIGTATTISSGYTTTISAGSNLQFTVDMTYNENFGTMELGSVYLTVENYENDEQSDMVVACLSSSIASYAEFCTEYESVTTQDSIFPTSGVTYNTQTIIEKYLRNASEEAYYITNPMWGINLDKKLLLKQFCILNAIKSSLIRTAVYAFSGATTWLGSIDVVDKEIQLLTSKISNTSV
jgi:hypothetical protein